MHKVKAHSGVTFNEKVDKMAKEALTSNALHITPADKSHPSLHLQQLALATPIRPLIKDITRAEHLVSLLNLDVNHKYFTLDINWMATAFCISDNDASSVTTFEMSALKRKKIQRILEMLSTMVVLNK